MPYRTIGDRYFFRDGKKKMVIEKVKPQHYLVTGYIIRKQIMLVSDETISYANVKIEVR